MNESSSDTTPEEPSVSGGFALLLSDDPVRKDDFGGAHQRVADGIANLIRVEKKGKAVALLGTWGSGKSSVVSILKAQLKSTKNAQAKDVRLFVFDAWSHQGDPLRRTFLEKLIDFFVDETDWFAKEAKWVKEQKEKLRSRTKKIEEEKTQHVTRVAIWIAVAAFLMPYSLFAVASTASGQWIPDIVVQAMFLLPLGIVVAAGFCCWFFPDFARGVKDANKKETRDEKFSNAVAGLVSGTSDSTVHTQHETLDRTTIEFQDDFARVMGKALSGTKRSIVMVIDNLDRIQPDEARSIWSTMRTFFEATQNNNERDRGWSERLWLLVPIDDGAARELWRQDAPRNGKPHALADAFIDKTFQAKFRIPPPVLSNWKEFFLEQIRRAFPKHDPAEFHTIYRMFDRLWGFYKPQKTPRDIKMFINEVGSYYRMWGTYIPLRLQALYVLRSKLDKIDDSDIRDKGSLGDLKGIIRDNNWQVCLAALKYNVGLEVAQQILVGAAIKEALQEGSGSKLIELNENVHDVPSVIECVLEENCSEWVRDDQNSFVNAALALEELRSGPEPDLVRHWDLWGRSWSETDAWHIYHEKSGRALSAVLLQCSDGVFRKGARELLQKICKDDIKDIEGHDILVPSDSKRWLAVARPTVDAVVQRDGVGELEESFSVPGPPAFYLDVVRRLDDEQGAYPNIVHFVTAHSEEDVVSALYSAGAESQFDESRYDTVIALQRVSEDWAWEQLVQLIGERLREVEVEPIEVRWSLRTLIGLAYESDVSDAKDELRDLCATGHLLHHVNKVRTKGDATCLATCVLPLVMEKPEGTPESQFGESEAGLGFYAAFLSEPESQHELVENLTDLVQDTDVLPALLGIADEVAEVRNLAGAVLREVRKSEYSDDYLDAEIVIGHFELLRAALTKDELECTIRVAIQKHDLVTRLQNESFTPKRAALFWIVLSVENTDQDQPFVAHLIEGLRTIADSQWTAFLLDEEPLVDLVLLLVTKGRKLGLESAFEDGLLRFCKDVLSGQHIPEGDPPANWSSLTEALEPNARAMFYRELKRLLTTRDRGSAPYLLKIFGEGLLSEGELLDNADDVVVLMRELSKGKQIAALDWVLRVLEKDKGILKKCKTKTREGFQLVFHEVFFEKQIPPEIKKRAAQLEIPGKRTFPVSGEEKGTPEILKKPSKAEDRSAEAEK